MGTDMSDQYAQVAVREWVLSLSLPLTLSMLVVMLCVVWIRLRELGIALKFYESEWNRAAIALIVFMTGVGLRVAWVWVLLREYLHEHKTTVIERFWWVDLIGGVLTVIGGLCVIREFSPRSWGSWPWIGAAAVTAGWTVAVHVF